jgi:hypothetical protein
MKAESWENYQLVSVWMWWDWELSGIAKKGDRRVWFECCEDNGFHRKFAIYDPPTSVWAEIDQRRADFIEHVGDHWEFSEMSDGTCRRSGAMRPQSEHHKFYDKYKGLKIKMLPEWQIAIADSGIDKDGNVIPIPEDDDE